jgi:hypothetical protein
MIHMIYKGKGNKENPTNYRGISLLSTIYTGALARRFNDWADRKDAVTEFQMGFRKGRRTTDNSLYSF